MSSVHPLVEKFRSGEVPPHLKAAAARGALPLPAADLLEILFALRGEKELQPDIAQTLENLPGDAMEEVARSSSETEMLDFLARASFKRQGVLEAVMLNPAVADRTFLLVARHGDQSVLELLVLNQTRLIRAPAIIQAVLDNPRVTLSVRRRLKEVWDLHQADSRPQPARKAPAAEAAPAPPEDVPVPQPEPVTAQGPPDGAATAAAPAAATADSSAGSESLSVADLGVDELDEIGSLSDLGDLVDLDGLDELGDLDELEAMGSELDDAVMKELIEEGADEDTMRLAERIGNMKVAEKVQLALKGNREARSLLIRESSKLIQEAVLKSPKITDDEIAKIANLRSVSADLLRFIGANREYTKQIPIVLALVRNPRTPPPTAIALLPTLQTRELKLMLTDKNIGEGVRRHAKVVMSKREAR